MHSVFKVTKISVCLACILAIFGCGGGGDSGTPEILTSGTPEILTVSVNYGGAAQLFKQSTIVPTLTGFNGRSPQCTLASGSVAPGMTLNADCSITGVPTDFGTYQFVVRIGAQGVSNQLAWSGGYAVFGPSLVYNFSDLLRLGVDIAPITTLNNIFWTATPADIVVYAVNSGALPAGLTIAPSTGTISGTPTALGAYSFKLQVQVTNSGRTATSIKQFPENLNVLQ